MLRFIARVLVAAGLVVPSSFQPPRDWVVKVTDDLPPSSTIDQTNSKLVPVYGCPDLPADALRCFPEPADGGPWLKVRLLPGDIVCDRHLSEFRWWGGSHFPPAGMRVITLQCPPDFTGKSCDRINYIVRRADMPSAEPILIAHNVEVFAVDTPRDPSIEKMSLLLSREGAIAILYALKTPHAVVEIDLLKPTNPSVWAATP